MVSFATGRYNSETRGEILGLVTLDEGVNMPSNTDNTPLQVFEILCSP